MLSHQLSNKREGADYTKAVSLIHFGCSVLIAKTITVAIGSDFTDGPGGTRAQITKEQTQNATTD